MEIDPPVLQSNTFFLNFRKNYQTSLYDVIATCSFEELGKYSPQQLIPYLPCLVRFSDNDITNSHQVRKHIFQLKQVSSINQYMRVNFQSVFQTIDLEIKARKKLAQLPADSKNTDPYDDGSIVGRYGDQVTAVFEQSSAEQRILIFLSDLGALSVQTQFKQTGYSSELLSNSIYLNELLYILPIVVWNVPNRIFTLEEIIRVLLQVPLAKPLIMCLIYNCTSSFSAIINILVNLSENNFPVIRPLLLDICGLSIRNCHVIRSILTERKMHASLTIEITMKYLHDEVAYLTAILNDDSSIWFKIWIQKESNVLTQLKEMLLVKLRNEDHVYTTCILRLLCGLTGLLGLQYSKLEIDTVLEIFSNYETVSQYPERLVQMGLIFLMICKNLTKLTEKELISKCLMAIMNAPDVQAQQTHPGHAVVAQTNLTGLLASVFFHCEQIQAVVDLVKQSLQWNVAIHSESLHQFGKLMTQVLNEHFVASRASTLHIVKKLSSKYTETLSPILCGYHLLRSRILNKQSIGFHDWVFGQLLETAEPIHPFVMSIIQEYVNCILSPMTNYSMNRFSEGSIKKEFGDSIVEKPVTPSQVCLLFYVLYYNDQYLKYKLDDKRSQTFVPSAEAYSREFVDCLPVKKILAYVESRSDQYGTMHASLLSLIIGQCPQLFNVVTLLHQEEYMEGSIESFLNIPSFSLTFSDWDYLPRSMFSSSSTISDPMEIEQKQIKLKATLEEALQRPLQATIALEELRKLLPDELYSYIRIVITTLLPQLLDYNIEFNLLTIFKSLWNKVYVLHPWQLSLQFINTIASKDVNTGLAPEFSHATLINDPLLLLKVDARVFRNPPILSIYLQILGSFMVATRKHYTVQAQLTKKNEEINTLLLAQESAMVQQLLEICIITDKDSSNLGIIEEVRVLICLFVHDLFIENPLMIKLLHFQGYPPELIPMTVTGIPSMHICLEFIGELLHQPHLEKQVFAIKLASHLAQKYPIPRSFEMAKLIVSHLRSHSNINESKYLDSTFLNSNGIPSKKELPPTQQPYNRLYNTEAAVFLIEVIPSLSLFCQAFPVLIEEISGFLLDITPHPVSSHNVLLERKNYLLKDTIKETLKEITKKLDNF